MRTEETILQQLIDNRLMSTNEEIDSYQDALDSLFVKEDHHSIGKLFNGFLDATENDEVMFSTVHAIEYFSKTMGLEKYILYVIPFLIKLDNDSYDWAETFFLRIINNDESFKVLINNIQSLKKIDLQFIEKLSKGLIKRNPEKFSIECNIILDKLHC